LHGDPHRVVDRKAIDPATDRRKRDARRRRIAREFERAPVARSQQRRLAAPAAVPHGTDGMDHVARLQPMAACDLRLACRAAAQRFAFA